MHHAIFDHRRLPPNCHAEWIMASDYILDQHRSQSTCALFITFKNQGPDGGTQGLVKIAQPPRAEMLQ